MNDSPTVARHRVRMAVREARERAELTQLQLAEQMEWSLSKVIRIENGDVTISPNDLRPLLTLLGVIDRHTVAGLLENAKTARTRQRLAWHQRPEFRDVLPYGMRLLVEYEADARLARYYSALFLPGPLQTAEYAERLTAAGPDLSAWRQTVLDARGFRQQAILRPDDPRDIRVLVDESVLRRRVGGPEVMAEQLRQLFRWAAERVLSLRMSPFAADAVANCAEFHLISLDPVDHRQTVLYRDNDLVEDTATIARHRERFDEIWNAAVDAEGTLNFIQNRIEYLDAIRGYRRTGAGAHHFD